MNFYLIIAGYAFTILNYTLYCISRFALKKKSMLFIDLLAKLSSFISLLCFNSFSGAYSLLASFFFLIFSNLKERYHKKWTLLYFIFEAILILIMIINFEGLPSILIFITSTISLISQWWLRPQHMRIAGMSTSTFSLLYQLSIRNYAGLMELIVIGSNVASYIKYKR